MSLTDRDRKILLVLAPLVLLLAYWFVVLAPQRSEAGKVEQELTKARGERDTAQAQIGQLNAAKASFASDYQEVIRMGKAIPDRVDMPSLLVQLDRAARGTGIEMNEIQVTPATEPEGGAAPAAPAPGGGANPGAGGTGAQSMPGKAAQGAGNAVNQANGASAQSAGAANGAPAAGATPTAPPAPGLSTVGLQFELRGDFFDMADFFHRMKRFVRVVNDQIVVRGRLMSIDNWSFETEGPGIKADVHASVYLSPKAQGGASIGASPGGPAPAPAGAGGGTVAADPASQSPSPSAPTATASP
ncbi:MAG TPA: type 4a pilus biogenesis protein PilO [Thermoleophilaceae bacterium]|jgi:hypothetical protein